MTIQEKAIEQLERISSHLSAIGEIEDYTDIAIQALEKGTCEDCISRAKTCDYIAEFINHEYSTQSECEMVDAIIEGIQHLPSVKQKTKTDTWSIDEVADALVRHGILKRVPIQEPCEDWNAVLDELNRIGRNAFKDDTDCDNLFDFISGLPSVKQEQGHWETEKMGTFGNFYRCSECNELYHTKTNYCPFCGAKLESEVGE